MCDIYLLIYIAKVYRELPTYSTYTIEGVDNSLLLLPLHKSQFDSLDALLLETAHSSSSSLSLRQSRLLNRDSSLSP